MKVNLIRDKECELSHRELKDRFQLSVGAISILKRKHEYISDYKQGEIADFLNLNQKSEKSKNQKPQKNLVLASSPLIMSLICIKKVKRKFHNILVKPLMTQFTNSLSHNVLRKFPSRVLFYNLMLKYCPRIR